MKVTHLLTAMRRPGISQMAQCAEERGRSVKDCWDLLHNNAVCFGHIKLQIQGLVQTTVTTLFLNNKIQ